MTESLDENMRGMGDPADYDAWAAETPAPAAERLELLPDYSPIVMMEPTVTAPAEDWDDGDGPDGPSFDERLTEIATELAELVGVRIGAPEPTAQTVTIKLTCARCNGAAFLVHLRLDPGVTNELYDTHLCSGGTVGEPAVFPFTLTARGGA